jgi:predicted metal-binding membrane protein
LFNTAASIVGAALLTLAITVYQMWGMTSGPGASLGALGGFVIIWVTMMAAMMLPSVAPMAMTFARVSETRASKGQAPFVSTWIFLAGYFAAWTVYGLGAYAIDAAIRAFEFGFFAWDRQGPVIAGAAIVAAGVYQLTPFKRACLAHCQSPLHFFMESWREGAAGAFGMGARHGLFCVGCCWGLMLVLFMLGVMSLFWMIVIAALIFAEKIFRVGQRLSFVFGAAFIVLGIWIAVAPLTVPGLHPPGSMNSMPGMDMSNMPGMDMSK